MKLEDLSKDELLDVIYYADRFGGGHFIEKAQKRVEEERRELCRIRIRQRKEIEKRVAESAEQYRAANGKLTEKYGDNILQAPVEEMNTLEKLYAKKVDAARELEAFDWVEER